MGAGKAGEMQVIVVDGAISEDELAAVAGWEAAHIRRVGTMAEAWDTAGAGDVVVAQCSASELADLAAGGTPLPQTVRILARLADDSGEDAGSRKGADQGAWTLITCGSFPALWREAAGSREEEGGSSGETDNGSSGDIGRMRATIARVHHDVNNPLSIISGNAQLFLELTRVMDVDDDLVQPVRDIEEASQRMSGILRKLAELSAPVSAPVAGDA
jgi:signal transduction histidine kinase